jgi:hypothetical protein
MITNKRSSICRNINILPIKRSFSNDVINEILKNLGDICISCYYKYEEIGAPKLYDPSDLHHIIHFADKFNRDPKLSLLLEETLVFLSTTNCVYEPQVTMDFIKSINNILPDFYGFLYEGMLTKKFEEGIYGPLVSIYLHTGFENIREFLAMSQYITLELNGFNDKVCWKVYKKVNDFLLELFHLVDRNVSFPTDTMLDDYEKAQLYIMAYKFELLSMCKMPKIVYPSIDFIIENNIHNELSNKPEFLKETLLYIKNFNKETLEENLPQIIEYLEKVNSSRTIEDNTEFNAEIYVPLIVLYMSTGLKNILEFLCILDALVIVEPMMESIDYDFLSYTYHVYKNTYMIMYDILLSIKHT